MALKGPVRLRSCGPLRRPYVACTTLINRFRDTMDARLLVSLLIAGFLLLSRLIHRFVERPVAGLLKRGLDTSFARMRNAGDESVRR